MPQAGFCWPALASRLCMQAQHFPAERPLTAITKALLHSLLLSELYPDISLCVINCLSHSAIQLQDFYPMSHLPPPPPPSPRQKGFVFSFFALLCFVSLCFVSVQETAKHVSLSSGIPVLWTTAPYANLFHKEFSGHSDLSYTRFYLLAMKDLLPSFW